MISELEEIIVSKIDLSQSHSRESILELLDEEVKRESKIHGLSIKERERLKLAIYNDIKELGILQELIEDTAITEIMVNGTEGIYIEKAGRLSRISYNFESKEKLNKVIWQITAECNRVVNEASPIVDARLKDGSRVNVVLDPVAINGPILTIRRFPSNPITMDKLIQYGSITEEAAEFLKAAVEKGANLLISGGTGTGKTTFLNILSNYIPEDERVITIEDSAELQLHSIHNLVRLETRNANVEGCREITIRDLLKTSLRMRPDRIIVGEVRSKEAIDMLQSVNVGHSAMTTVHANSVRDVISRLETMVLMGMDIPIKAIRGQIVSGFDLMIHIVRCRDGSRKIYEIAEPIEMIDGEIIMNTIFVLNNNKLQRTGEVVNEKIS